jgi:hypothetical protein
MANPTTYFGWVMPTATDLVTDLPADFNVFGQGVDTSMQDLLGGTTGQVLAKTSATDMDFTWTTPQVGDITGVTAGTGISGGGTSGTVTVSINTAVTADLTTAQTLTNKTLTTPVIASISNSGTVTLPTGTQTLVGRTTTDTLTNKTLTTPIISSISNTGTLTLPTSTDTLVGRATTDTLTNKTLTAPVANNPLLKSPEERLTISATAATGTVAFDTQTQGILYYTTNASANFTLNFTNVNANLTTGDSISCVFLNTNGATAYYPTAFQVDSVGVTPKWSGGTAPSAGNASAIDSYSFIIIKTGAATFTVLAGGAVKFA